MKLLTEVKLVRCFNETKSQNCCSGTKNNCTWVHKIVTGVDVTIEAQIKFNETYFGQQRASVN